MKKRSFVLKMIVFSDKIKDFALQIEMSMKR